jgi:hypothetical protein
MYGSASPFKTAVNREFTDILAKGSIDDVGALIENSAPLPEVGISVFVFLCLRSYVQQQLSVSTRNQLYDIISTLLFQGKHIERSLVWILAMTRGKQKLMQELTVHTQKDLLEALKKVSREASKRGMLATLLVSQINRQLSA